MTTDFEKSFDAILSAPQLDRDAGDIIGSSRGGRELRAVVLGRGSKRISLVGGAHADEPVGPRLLRHLASYLQSLAMSDPLLARYTWWILPHVNPDGEAINRAWHADDDSEYDLIRYLGNVVRELPGDDIEFGYPRDADDVTARPENRAAANWWRSGGTFHLHASLHGMGFAAGPWFLIDAAWRDRTDALQGHCAARTKELGYVLHDVERHGEKGFVRLRRGFCTRPDSRAMRAHFEALGDDATAALFRPSSMEFVRSLGGDPLTLVSEMPLFLTPGVGETLGPPDPIAEEWKKKITLWRAQVERDHREAAIRKCAESGCLSAMPVRDQMRLQWIFICAGIAAIA